MVLVILMAKEKSLVREDGCNGCGICVSVCPVNNKGEEIAAIIVDGAAAINEEACKACGLCAKNCSMGILSVVEA